MSSEPHFGLATGDGRRPRIMVVDGNVANSMVTIALARQFGCMPVAAPNGEAALALLRRDGGIDLVILDMGLADREGVVLAQLIRTLGERGTMPIVALVAGARLPGKAVGVTAALRKPYSPRELYGAMRDSLARVASDRRAMHARLTRLDLHVYPTQANFFLVRLPEGHCARLCRDHLLTEHGVFVRDCANKAGIDGRHLRLAVRPAADVDRLVAGLDDFLGAASLWRPRRAPVPLTV